MASPGFAALSAVRSADAVATFTCRPPPTAVQLPAVVSVVVPVPVTIAVSFKATDELSVAVLDALVSSFPVHPAKRVKVTKAAKRKVGAPGRASRATSFMRPEISLDIASAQPFHPDSSLRQERYRSESVCE
jgi:hypothetical protein